MPLTFVSPVSQTGRWEDDIQKSRQAWVIPAVVGMKDGQTSTICMPNLSENNAIWWEKTSMEFNIKWVDCLISMLCLEECYFPAFLHPSGSDSAQAECPREGGEGNMGHGVFLFFPKGKVYTSDIIIG